MIVALIFLVLAVCLYLFGGWLRGLFEAVLLFDSVDDWFGPFWAFKLFASDKDRNGDGKVTFWELNFPKDGGHRAKLYELLSYSFGSCFLAICAVFVFINYTLPWQAALLIASVIPFVIWWIISVGFLISFNKYRKAK